MDYEKEAAAEIKLPLAAFLWTKSKAMSYTTIRTAFLKASPKFDRIEVNYEKDMWICYVLDRSRDGPYAVFGKHMDCSDDYICVTGLRL